MSLEDEGLMERPREDGNSRNYGLENQVAQAPEVSEVRQTKKVKYEPIKRLGDGRLAAYDIEIGGVVVFGSSDQNMVERELAYEKKYRADYETYFPPTKIEEKPVVVEPSQVQTNYDSNSSESSAGDSGLETQAEVVEEGSILSLLPGVKVVPRDDGLLSLVGQTTVPTSSVGQTAEVRGLGNVVDAPLTDEKERGDVETPRYCQNSKCATAHRKSYAGKICGNCGEHLCSELTAARRGRNLKFNREIGKPLEGTIISRKEFERLKEAHSILYENKSKAMKISGEIDYDGRVRNNFGDLIDSLESHLEKEKGVALEVTKRVAGDLGSWIGRTAKSAAKVGFKTIAYPIVGNLSANLQTRLENLVGKDWYDAVQATKVSIIPNALIQTAGAGYLGHYLSTDKLVGTILTTSFVGVYSGFLEGWCVRDQDISIKEEETRWRIQAYGSPEPRPCGSLVGKLISLPIELGIWGGKKVMKGIESAFDYIDGITDEVRNGKSYESKNVEEIVEEPRRSGGGINF